MKLLSVLLLILLSWFSTAFPLTLPNTITSLIQSRAAPFNGSTQSDLVNNLPCKALTVIFARGTVSPGNVGEDTGPPFFQAVAKLIGSNNLAVQGVDYPAGIFGFLSGGDAGGAKKMTSLVERAFSQCPETKVVMSGYSQGAQLVHNSAKQLTNATAARISSVVMFGDPFNGTAVGNIDPSKVKTFCHRGDNICEGGIFVLPPHRNYSNDATAAAEFVGSKAGL